MDLETSRNCPVLINPINPMICFSTDPGIYKVLCCYCRMVYLHYMYSFFLEGGREMDFEISRNFPVMMNPVKSLSINSGTYWVFCCYYWIVYLYFTFYTGDESTVMSLYGSRDFILFLSLFDICGGVGNTRLSKNIARIYLFFYFFIS